MTFEALFLHVVPYALVDALAFHAAVLAGDGHGFLCVGASGAGKSTLVGLLPERALGDELSVVKRAEDRFTVMATPYRQGRRGEARLAAIYLLSHGPTNRRTALPPAPAAQALTPQLFWPLDDAVATQRTLALLGELVERVPVWRLSFVPTPEVWDVIAAETP